MKNLLVLTLIFVLLLASCSEKNNPISSDLNDAFSTTYIGKIGTQHVYSKVRRWYVPYTDSPFVSVPDSLMNLVEFSIDELKDGIIEKSELTQIVDTMSHSYYTKWNLKYPYSQYTKLNGSAWVYSVVGLLEAKAYGYDYYGYNSGYDGGRFVETNDSIVGLHYPFGANTIEMLKPLEKDRQWKVEEREYVDSYDGKVKTINKSRRVIGMVTVTVQAGTFNAYKIEETTNWPESNYSIISKYQYYVPNIGLVLEEWDKILHQITLGSHGTSVPIIFREVVRNELVSFAIKE